MFGNTNELKAQIASLTAERDYAQSRMVPHPNVSHPALTAEHLKNARLFANREDMVASLNTQIGRGRIAELGVATGDFSKVLLRLLDPIQFVGLDIFEMHHAEPSTNALGQALADLDPCWCRQQHASCHLHTAGAVDQSGAWSSNPATFFIVQ